ncbi:MAG: zinc ribbon domain-containing protein [Planctomycetaceae bacterium]|nr:hypothetical protein [Planctomycetota bacterium]MCQ3949706.1 zinc ribbon domain-containing protein [Planctomycetota bacterium]NUO16109.1 zinc ribbon domain-containing protein [Planctomycetaceae bacterium]GIK53367.1 MAG: FmdB family transcriptional regulator [Planctomycetota bacterium]HRJ79201.1 zinc ribbon domain-containing protein [Planctomycetota bacterium]
MPTYEYACPDCGHEFEAFHAMSAAPVKLCPKCGKKKVKRLMSAGSGLIFKGSGFYLTDYARKGTAASDSKPESKSEAKPDKGPSHSCGPGCGHSH